MNFGRVAAAALAAWIAYLIIGYIVNDVLLAGAYAAETAFRPRDQLNLPVGFAASLFGFFVFAYAYAKGYEGTSGVQEGLRYGVIVALMIICFALVWEYVIFPISSRLLGYMVVDALVEFAIYGSIVGAIYRPAPKKITTETRRPQSSV